MHEKIRRWAYTGMVASISILMLIAVLFFAFVMEEATPWREMRAADWGVWAGAVGTVATLAGTIWIATNTERKAKREQLDLAVIAAVSAALWIADFRNAITRANQGKPDDLSDLYRAKVSLNNCLKIVEEVGVLGMSDLRPLVYLPKHLAARLAHTSKDISSATRSFRHAIRRAELKNRDATVFHTIFIDELRASNDELFAIQDECLLFLANNGYGDDT